MDGAAWCAGLPLPGANPAWLNPAEMSAFDPLRQRAVLDCRNANGSPIPLAAISWSDPFGCRSNLALGLCCKIGGRTPFWERRHLRDLFRRG
jgi:hypothetical protein